MEPGAALVLVKLTHTAAWAFLVFCILAIPAAALRGRWRLAVVASAIVFVEVLVLVVHGMRCPLTDLAARYTRDRGDAFDIYLPPWLARHNKQVFGTVFFAGEVVLAWRWLRSRR